jgi:hypothetical protein
MGFLNMFKKPDAPAPMTVTRLPSGSFTIDSTGQVVVCTIPRSFPEPLLRQISALVLATFQRARDAQLPLTELVVHYASLKLTAREMRGGAIIFLAPRSLQQK